MQNLNNLYKELHLYFLAKMLQFYSRSSLIGRRNYANVIVRYCKTKDLSHINAFVKSGYCKRIETTISKIDYKNASYDSIETKRDALQLILKKHGIGYEHLQEELLELMIPPGLKAALRGNKFNYEILEIIHKELNALASEPGRFLVQSELKVPELAEKLDFYIFDQESGKSLYGYNQIDLWSGGHQTNRADKYILSDNLHTGLGNDKKLICVIQKHVEVKRVGNKVYSVFKAGIEKQRLFYPGHLGVFLKNYFC